MIWIFNGSSLFIVNKHGRSCECCGLDVVAPYLCPHTVSAYCYIFVLTHSRACVSAYCYICVFILLHMCPHPAGTTMTQMLWWQWFEQLKTKKTKTLKKSYKALTPWSFVPPKKKLRPGTLPQEVCVCVCMCVRRGRNSKRLQCGLMGPPRGHRHPNYTRNCELTNI